MLSSKLKTTALTAALMLASQGAMATTLTNTAGSFSNWGGFDWASNGSAIAFNFDPTAVTNTFNLTYFANAVAVTSSAGPLIPAATSPLISGTYEYTILATLNETSTCTTFSGGICTSATFQINSGGFNIYYGVPANADLLTGAGITDGSLLITGNILSQPGGGFNIVTGGNATLQALITYTNGAYISPDLLNSIATTTLQTGSNVTNWTAPSGQPVLSPAGGFIALDCTATGTVCLQADGNQTFSSVPEPASLALLGLGLTGMAFARRRKQA